MSVVQTPNDLQDGGGNPDHGYRLPEWAWEILQCPITGRRLRWASDDEIRILQRRQRDGELRNRLGQRVEGLIDVGLVDQTGEFFYELCDGIANLLPDEAIPLREKP